ncbi:hypothetical protein cyc_04762 [Cyclospora cayetanensis]|uniref:Uncharacterized protein n=1 Tax=Cyclospora cayetanensis TaxID=88456 RepID=A0A1D3CY09_9EIME|nr:hypothetical protein cyc_04762 [Cyclospora cayetanensis]
MGVEELSHRSGDIRKGIEERRGLEVEAFGAGTERLKAVPLKRRSKALWRGSEEFVAERRVGEVAGKRRGGGSRNGIVNQISMAVLWNLLEAVSRLNRHSWGLDQQ